MDIAIRRFEYHLVDHCNLNCAGCTHFSPLAEKRFADVEKFEANLKRFRKVVPIYVKEFNLIGGEPLLHPEIISFMKIARKYFPFNTINVITNGILLESMPSEFFKTVLEEKIHICLSNYLNLKFSKRGFINKIYEKGTFFHKFISTEKEPCTKCQDPYFDFELRLPCCQIEENGDIHYCGYSANIKHYNKFYGTDIQPVRGEDYLNIYEDDITLEEFKKKYSSVHPFCQYCRKPSVYKWHTFNGTDEWKA